MPGDTAIARALRRGECPSVHEPFLELDGALVRIRVPGGLLAVDAARAIADVAAVVGAGPVEITNRANLQLRGVPPTSAPEVAAALIAAGVACADAGADERRNVLASPMAGVDPTELVDTRDLVARVDALLASDAAAGCSSKFGVVIDGGGAVHARGRPLDVAIGALRMDDGSVRYHVRLADALPLDYHDAARMWCCELDDAFAVMAAAIDVCRSFGRARALLDAWGPTRVWAEIGERVPAALARVDAPTVPQPSTGPSAATVGVHPQRHSGVVAVGAVARLGRLDADTLRAVAELAVPTLRLTPARGAVVTDVPESDAASVVAQLDALGLVTDPDHPATAVVACVGSRGCASGFVDTLTDAHQLIRALGALPPDRRPRSVHVSGCEKGCAHPGPTEWALVGGPEHGTYTARRDGIDLARGLNRGAAIALVTEGPP